MKQIVTLVSSSPETPLCPHHLEMVADIIGVVPEQAQWLASDMAADLAVPGPVSTEQREQLLQAAAPDKIDCFFTVSGETRRKKLLVADMDNTMVIGETLDDLADHCGLKEQIAAITDKAMRGELDFKEALRERVKMLAGLPETALAATAQMIQLMPGAKELVKVMSSNGARCILVSGGFTPFTSHVADILGFHDSQGNLVEVVDGKMTGEVFDPIIDFARKQYFLEKYAAEAGLPLELTMAVGDGANDLAMLLRAGLGVGFHPKPILQQQVVNCVLYGDLTALLYAQGYTAGDIACCS